MKLNRRILIVFMHILGWAIILLIPKYLMHQTLKRFTLVHELSMWLPVIIVFYLNFYVLVPRLLTRRRFLQYTLSVVSLVTVFFVFIEIFDRYYFVPRFMPPPPFARGEFKDSLMMHPGPAAQFFFIDSVGQGKFDALRKGPLEEKGFRNVQPGERIHIRMIRRKIDFFVLLILAIAVSTSIKITGKWYSNEKERKEMENQKLIAELSFLKSQINPHFFFNTLNSIYSLAIQKSAKTPEAIVKLSELMRYIIYEADKNLVPLKKELEYIRNYVELQKLRLMSNVKVTYNIEGIYSDIMIEPLLFLPFIENAFKYGVDSTKDCEIKIKFVITTEQLKFTVENPLVQQSKKQPVESSGIGLANTKKRLELLYGENHHLKVTQSDNNFLVELDLKIREHELHNS